MNFLSGYRHSLLPISWVTPFTQPFFLYLPVLEQCLVKQSLQILFMWSFGGSLIDKALWRYIFYSFPQECIAACWFQRGCIEFDY